MRSLHITALLIVERFKNQGYVHVPGYNRFGYLEDRGNLIVVSREAGQDTKIYIKKLEEAIQAVRDDPSIYDDGPRRSRDHKITHLTSPVWALLHVLSREELLA